MVCFQESPIFKYLILMLSAANKKGSPFSFTIGAGKVVKGMDIGVQGMSAGGERRISIPAELGYGKKGSPPSIPPHSELIFDLKMLEVK